MNIKQIEDFFILNIIIWNILLNTCNTEAHSDQLHYLIKKYGARGISIHSGKINPLAVREVMRHLGEVLKEAQESGCFLHPADLFYKAAEKALDDPGSKEYESDIREFQSEALQISVIQVRNDYEVV